jgi:ribosomal protein S18 acetylase RimI-like enzyme
MNTLLDNVMWNALNGAQRQHSVGTDDARRYAPGFSALVGFSDPKSPNFPALSPYCALGESFYCDCLIDSAPRGWKIDAESTMLRMVWDGAEPAADDAPDAEVLGREHVDLALDLTTLTRPGPFGPRTMELGDYLGYLDGKRLMAMAGERLHAGAFREVSGVCTHPDFQGRGLARRLMMKLVRWQLRRGETPFLHVMSNNKAAHALYERLGFRTYRETVVRVVSRVAS